MWGQETPQATTAQYSQSGHRPLSRRERAPTRVVRPHSTLDHDAAAFASSDPSPLSFRQRNVRHHRMTKQGKLRHVHVMREKVVEVPERLKVDDTNDPLGGPDAEAIISRRMAESVNNRRAANGGFFTS